MFLNCVVLISAILHLAEGTKLFQHAKDFPLNEDERLAKNYLVFPDTSKCDRLFSVDSELAFREKAHVGGELAQQLFGENALTGSNSNDCPAVCLGVGTHLDYIVYPFSEQVYTGGGNPMDWVHNFCQKKEFGIINYGPNEANLYWMDGDKRVMQGTIGKGERHTQWRTTYLGHKFELVDSVTKELMGSYTIEFDTVRAYGTYGTVKSNEKDYTREIEVTFNNEWARHNNVKRTYTEYGFARGRLPNDLFGSMNAYYYNNDKYRVHEEWGPGKKGVFVNWWEQDVFMVQMPVELKKKWQAQLRGLVEAWSGAELELTDIYGMRRYEEGARLLTHVDREQTHALSLIVNVAQQDIRKPWPVEIYDLEDRLHQITMEPGDIVYYESARCLHGRMQPLEGKYYANLFAHYRPVENGVADPMWYRQTNPEDNTRTVGPLDNCEVDAMGGGGVKCSHKGEDLSVPFLTHPIDQLKGPGDLFRYWKDTAPKVPIGKQEL